MILITSPNPIVDSKQPIVFLAGSISGNTASNWQLEVIDQLSEQKVTLLNPRRDSWDASWKEDITNPEFKKQVTWELNALEQSDLIIMYFDPKTQAPISLLELGLYAQSGKLIVCCPEGFWKKGNVDIVCETYHIPQVATLDNLIEKVKETF